MHHVFHYSLLQSCFLIFDDIFINMADYAFAIMRQIYFLDAEIY